MAEIIIDPTDSKGPVLRGVPEGPNECTLYEKYHKGNLKSSQLIFPEYHVK